MSLIPLILRKRTRYNVLIVTWLIQLFENINYVYFKLCSVYEILLKDPVLVCHD